jgi:hypothetical protein
MGSGKFWSQTRVELRKRARVEQREKTRVQRSAMPMWTLAHGEKCSGEALRGHMSSDSKKHRGGQKRSGQGSHDSFCTNELKKRRVICTWGSLKRACAVT